MPKTTMNKDRSPVFWKHQVWPSWKVFCMQPVTETQGVESAPHNQLGLGVLAPYTAHHPAARRLVDDISHSRPSWAMNEEYGKGKAPCALPPPR